MTLDDSDLFDAPSGPRPGAAPPRKCRRHEWVAINKCARMALRGNAIRRPDGSLRRVRCAYCGKSKDDAATRRGRNNRARGNAIEREVARKLGLRRVGQYGGPEDAESEWLVVQVKSGGAFPERIWKWLQALPANADQTRAVVVTDAPGPGHKRRALVVVDLDDWQDLHGVTR